MSSAITLTVSEEARLTDFDAGNSDDLESAFVQARAELDRRIARRRPASSA